MRISAMIRRVLKEMIRDKRTLALMMIAPLFILTLVYFLFQSNNNQTATLGVRNVDSSLVKAVKNDNLKVRQITSDKSAKSIIRDKDYAGVLTQKDQKLTLTLQNSDQTKSGLLKKSLQQAQVKLKMQAAASGLKAQKEVIAAQAKALKAIQETMGAGAQNSGVKAPASLKAAKASAYSVNTHYLYGSSDSTFFDTILPIMIGFVVFFFVFLISGIALLKERTTGTLNRLLATPIKRGEIIAGYLSGYGIFAFIQTVVIVLYTMYVFKIQILGSVWYVILINILLAFVALALGLLNFNVCGFRISNGPIYSNCGDSTDFLLRNCPVGSNGKLVAADCPHHAAILWRAIDERRHYQGRRIFRYLGRFVGLGRLCSTIFNFKFIDDAQVPSSLEG